MSTAKVLGNETLKGIMTDAMCCRSSGYAGCIEDCTQTGYYVLIFGATTTQTPPPSGGWEISILEVIQRSSNDLVQRLTETESGKVFVRTCRLGAWRAWKEVAMS